MLKEADRDILLFRSRFLKQKDYWDNKLSGHFEETDIMLDYETGAGPDGTAEPGNVIIPLGVPLGRRIIALSKGSDLSVYILLLAALKALIYRYSGNEDIIIFTPVNRLKISRETLNSTLLLRDTVEGAMTFKELVLRVRQSVLEAHENQDYPFDKLVGSMSLSLPHIRCTLGNLHRDKDIDHADRHHRPCEKDEYNDREQHLLNRPVDHREHRQTHTNHLKHHHPPNSDKNQQVKIVVAVPLV